MAFDIEKLVIKIIVRIKHAITLNLLNLIIFIIIAPLNISKRVKIKFIGILNDSIILYI